MKKSESKFLIYEIYNKKIILQVFIYLRLYSFFNKICHLKEPIMGTQKC